MRTLTLHTADELVTRWKRRAFELDVNACERESERDTHGRQLAALDRERAQGYRVCAAELAAILAASMEMEAAHHGDPEPITETVSDDPNALREWLQGERP